MQPTAAAENTLKVLVYPGDGIGKEVIDEAVKCLRAAEERLGGFKLELEEVEWGVEYWKKTGQIVPPDYLEIIKKHDAVLLGALGDPRVLPDHVTLVPLIQMRQQLDQYICLRPAKLLEGVRPALAAGPRTDKIDIVVVRENSEGEYSGNGGIMRLGMPEEVATEVAVHTRHGVERCLRYAFSLARERSKHVTLATKSNALKFGMVMWDRIFAEVAAEYPDVRADKCHVDALAMDFVRRPATLDVVVGSNLFGDILSDLAGAIVGSLGLAPSANINPERRFPSMFEPVHGSALDIVGTGKANPIATIRAAAMMLHFLGQKEAGLQIDAAVFENLRVPSSPKTPDIGGVATTSQVGDEIVRLIKTLPL